MITMHGQTGQGMQPGYATVPPAAVTPDGTGWRPPNGLPCPSAMNYWRNALGLLVLVVALPWLLYHLVTDPAKVLAGRGTPPGA